MTNEFTDRLLVILVSIALGMFAGTAAMLEFFSAPAVYAAAMGTTAGSYNLAWLLMRYLDGDETSLVFHVRNFSYNGFFGQDLPGLAPYTATFKTWTRDPGVAEFECSDGETRRIPTFALIGEKNELPPQDYKKLGGKDFFGPSVHS